MQAWQPIIFFQTNLNPIHKQIIKSLKQNTELQLRKLLKSNLRRPTTSYFSSKQVFLKRR